MSECRPTHSLGSRGELEPEGRLDVGGVIEQLEQRAVDAEQRAARLRKMVTLAQELGDEGLVELAGLLNADKRGVSGNGHTTANGAAEASEKVPRGREAVRRVVGTRPGLWTLSEIVAELEAREWFRSRKGAEVAVVRMIADGEGRRIRKGQYQFPANHGEEVAIESERSGAAMIASG